MLNKKLEKPVSKDKNGLPDVQGQQNPHNSTSSSGTCVQS